MVRLAPIGRRNRVADSARIGLDEMVAARPKILRHDVTCFHGLNHGAQSVSCQAAGAHNPVTAQVRSSVVRSPTREKHLPESAKIFVAALDLTPWNQADVAAATGLSATIVSKWSRGERPIPADCVWSWLTMLPALGMELLILCAEALPADLKPTFKARVARMR